MKALMEVAWGVMMPDIRRLRLDFTDANRE
jgi:hypothetical protein